jgi:hypothetical protein
VSVSAVAVQPLKLSTGSVASLLEGKVETRVAAISFLDLLEFIANVKFVTEVFERKRNHVTFISIHIYVCVYVAFFAGFSWLVHVLIVCFSETLRLVVFWNLGLYCER